MEFEKLDALLRTIHDELQLKERHLKDLIEDVQRLQKEARTLENARELLIKDRPAGLSLSDMLKAEGLSLQEEIMKCWDGRNVFLSPVDISSMLKNRSYPNSDGKNFKISVYTTLKRLVMKGRLLETVGDNSRLYIKPPEPIYEEDREDR